MGNKKKHEGSTTKGEKRKVGREKMESYLERTGQAMREASVVARQATAIERGGRAAAESIRDRAVT